ncbi:MAG: hypothetical protein JXR37_12515 [Kiritimatiellae bacterium]|nr:hypothetical protein [Kiritimatiellia bacterium]
MILRRHLIAARWALIAAAVLILHAGLVLRHFPPSSLGAAGPLCSGDLNWHFPSTVQGYTFVSEGYRIWGYSVAAMAGYPWGVWNSFGWRGFEFSSILFPGLGMQKAYYLWVVLVSFLTPLVPAAACRVLRWSWRDVAGVALVGIVLYQAGDVLSDFWVFGSIVFPFASALVLIYVALLWRALNAGRFLFACVAGVLLGIIFWLHPLCLIPAAIGSLSAVWIARASLRQVASWARLAVLLLVAAFVVAPWLGPLLRFWDARIPRAYTGLQTGLKHLFMDFLSDRAYRQHYDRRALFQLLVVLAGTGAWAARRAARREVAVFFWAACGSLVPAYTLGCAALLRQTQPYRFLVSLVLFAILPAWTGLRHVAGLFRAVDRPGRALVWCASLLLMPAFLPYGMDVLRRQPAFGVTARQRAAADWLRERAEVPGRVLCEDGALGNLLPYLAGREVIGGLLSDHSPLLHSWACVGLKRAFGFERTKADLSPMELREYLRLYNVAFAIAASPELKARLRALPDLCRVAAEIEPWTLFAIDPATLTYVWNDATRHATRVNARANHIVVENAPPGRFVLKYHFIRSLKARDGVALYPHWLLDDPVPFVGVVNTGGLSRVEIYNEY